MATNLSTYYQASVGQRAPISGADWAGGMNKGGSNSPGIGVTTGIADVKEIDWSRTARLLEEGQHFGLSAGGILTGSDNGVSFVQAVGSVAPNAVVANGARNRTGQPLVAGQWVWGEVA